MARKMSDRELIAALRRLKVETGSIACLGCGCEHNCSVHGCHIMRQPWSGWSGWPARRD